MQIKATLMTIIKKNLTINASEMWEMGDPYILLIGVQTSKAAMEIGMDVSQKIKNRSVIWLLDIYPNISISNHRDNLYIHICCCCIHDKNSMKLG